MKKLLAILLTLAMMVPMGGVAEETAPGATRTVIFLKDFNAGGGHRRSGGESRQ